MTFECRECGQANDATARRCKNKDCRFILIVPCAACGKDVREEDSYGEGDIGDEDIPSFCSDACYQEGETFEVCGQCGTVIEGYHRCQGVPGWEDR